MLSAAGHAKGDIHAALARERTRHPGLRWTYAVRSGRNRCSLTCSPAQRGRGPGAVPPARRRQIVVARYFLFPGGCPTGWSAKQRRSPPRTPSST